MLLLSSSFPRIRAGKVSNLNAGKLVNKGDERKGFDDETYRLNGVPLYRVHLTASLTENNVSTRPKPPCLGTRP